MKPYLLHAAAVHFPIALLGAGWLACVLERRREALRQTVSSSLWLGTLAAWVALGLGFVAEETAPHVPAAWRTLAAHERLAWATAVSFTALSAWRWRAGRLAPRLFLAAWTAACGLLLATAFEGGELVFEHGVGVERE